MSSNGEESTMEITKEEKQKWRRKEGKLEINKTEQMM